MRWQLVLGLVAGCDHFELDARVTVRDGQGQLQLGHQTDGIVERRYGFFDLAEAIEEPAMFEVVIGKQVVELPLRVDGCHESVTRAVGRAEVDYELFHAGGKLQLQPTGGSCITADTTTSFAIEARP